MRELLKRLMVIRVLIIYRCVFKKKLEIGERKSKFHFMLPIICQFLFSNIII